MNSTHNSNNENTKIFIKKTTDVIRQGRQYYLKAQDLIVNAPIQIKIANILVPFVLTFIFTYLYYNLPLSIIFAIITFFVIFIMSKLAAVIFIVLYAVSISNVYKQRQNTIGIPILQTDIIKNKMPFNASSKALTIQSTSLPQDLNGGYFSYSFWLYVDSSNYSSTGYRYTEWKSVFYRGDPISSTTNLPSTTQYPGVWLTPKLNNLVIVFQSSAQPIERIELNNIPINSWFNVAVVVESKSVSIYMNGLLDNTVSLTQSVQIMNTANLYITSDNKGPTGKTGFVGSIAELIFFNYALTPTDVYNSYLYYNKIITNYQNGLNSKNTYNISSLITNSDYNEQCSNC